MSCMLSGEDEPCVLGRLLRGVMGAAATGGGGGRGGRGEGGKGRQGEGEGGEAGGREGGEAGGGREGEEEERMIVSCHCIFTMYLLSIKCGPNVLLNMV